MRLLFFVDFESIVMYIDGKGSEGGNKLLQYYVFDSMQDVFSILWYQYSAQIMTLILLFLVIKGAWGYVFFRMMQQYKYKNTWIAYLPYGKFWFRLDLKEKPFIVLFIPILTIPLMISLFIMNFSLKMLIPGVPLILLILIQIISILNADKEIYRDFEIDERRVWFSLIPILGWIQYVVNYVRMALSPEVYHDFTEDVYRNDWNK